jgi:predicted metal-dependent hydrolase
MHTMSKKLSKERVQRILNGGDEPLFTPEDFASDEARAKALDRGMYFYRQSFSPSDAREWISEWFAVKGRRDDAKLVSRVSKGTLRLVCPYCRMETRGFQWTPEQADTIQKYIADLLTEARAAAPADTDAPNIQERLRAKADDTLSELEPLIDQAFTEASSKRYKPVIAPWIASKTMTRPTALIVKERLQTVVQEMQAAYSKTDPDLCEGYSYLKRPVQKRLIEIFQEAVGAVDSKIGGMSTTRKPRKPRKANPEKLVKRLKYCQKADIGLQSVDPRGIIGAQGLLVFNTKNHKATVFVAAEPKAGLSVKGSTITGWDASKSYEKTVRKWEEWLKKTAGLLKALEDAKTKTAVPTGRINKHCLLLKTL